MVDFCGMWIKHDLNLLENKSSVMAADLVVAYHTAEKVSVWVYL